MTDEEHYSLFRAQVEARGFATGEHPSSDDSLVPVCASQSDPLGGNSFRVERKDDRWTIVTWSCRVYGVPQHVSLIDVATDLLRRQPENAYGVLPEEIVTRYELELIDDGS